MLESLIKNLLFSGSGSMIGIDIGASSIKVAQVVSTGDSKYRLAKFAHSALPEGALIEDEVHEEEAVISVLRKCLKKASASGSATIGLGGTSTIIKKLQLAGGSFEEIEDQVLWEIEQYVPFGIDDSSVSFDIVNEHDGGGVDVVIAVAENKLIQRFKTLTEVAGVNVKIIDMDIIAVSNIFEFLYEDIIDPEKNYLILDFGAEKTKVVVYQDNAILFYKEMDFGGGTITEEIQRQMGVNFLDAEDLKIFGDGNDSYPEEVVEITDRVLTSFISELSKVMDYFTTTSSDDPIEHCFITGGGMLSLGLVEALQDTLEMEVQMMNPFDRMAYDKGNFTEEQLKTVSARGAVAMGLAMRAIEK